MIRGYAVTNALSGLAATAFTWSSAYTTNRARLNDGVQDELAAGSASPQASGQYLQIDRGALGSSMRALALLNHNLASGSCSVTIRVSDDVTFASFETFCAASAVNASAPYQKDTVLLGDNSISHRYVRIIFTHSGTKTITIGEVFVAAGGSMTLLTRSQVYGSGESERFVLNRNESRTGNVRSTFVGGPIRTIFLPFADLSGTSQRDEIMEMWRATQGGNLNLLWIANTNGDGDPRIKTVSEQECLWGKLQETLGWTEQDYRVFGIDGLVLVGQGREVGS